MNSFVISGGPGAGKTTLILALQEKGFRCMEEASRELIKEEVSRKGNCLPWKDLPCFALKALDRMVNQYQEACRYEGPVFFDRGIPDIIAYLKVAGIAVSEKFHEEVQLNRYHEIVFVAPPWKEIYCNDEERWQSFEEATALYHMITETYKSAAYRVIVLPKASTESRVDFILSCLPSLHPEHRTEKNFL